MHRVSAIALELCLQACLSVNWDPPSEQTLRVHVNACTHANCKGLVFDLMLKHQWQTVVIYTNVKSNKSGGYKVSKITI